MELSVLVNKLRFLDEARQHSMQKMHLLQHHMHSLHLAVLVSLTLSYAQHSNAASTQTAEAKDDERSSKSRICSSFFAHRFGLRQVQRALL